MVFVLCCDRLLVVCCLRLVLLSVFGFVVCRLVVAFGRRFCLGTSVNRLGMMRS